MTIFAPRRYELAAGQLLGREGFAVREIDTGLVARSFNNRIPAYAWWLHTTCVFKEFEDDPECRAVVERHIVLHDDTVRESWPPTCGWSVTPTPTTSGWRYSSARSR